jgi:hypothetical protein
MMKTSRRNAVVIARAVVADEVPHRHTEVARYETELVATYRCEPCSLILYLL